MSKSKCLSGNIKSNKEQFHEATLHNDLSSLYQQPLLAAAPLSEHLAYRSLGEKTFCTLLKTIPLP